MAPPPIFLPHLSSRVQNKQQFITLSKPWKVVSRLKFPRNLKIYGGKAKNIPGIFGEKKPHLQKNSRILRGKKPRPGKKFFGPQSQNPTSLPGFQPICLLTYVYSSQFCHWRQSQCSNIQIICNFGKLHCIVHQVKEHLRDNCLPISVPQKVDFWGKNWRFIQILLLWRLIKKVII